MGVETPIYNSRPKRLSRTFARVHLRITTGYFCFKTESVRPESRPSLIRIMQLVADDFVTFAEWRRRYSNIPVLLPDYGLAATSRLL